MTAPDDILFLLDCDKTAPDNNRLQNDLRMQLAGEFDLASRDRK